MAKKPASPKVEGIGVVPKEALRFLKGKALKTSLRWQEVYAEEHAASLTVAGVSKMDLLQDIHESLNTAIEKGVPFAAWKKELQPTLVKHGWWGEKTPVWDEGGQLVREINVNPRRLKTIYSSNVRSAYAAGQWERAERTKLALPYLVYELGPSKEHRAEHQRWAGTILPVDDAWWDSHMPPNGWLCKCRVRQVSRTEAAKKGYDPTARPFGEGQTKEFKNKSTGVTRQVPVGIDPGWESNPGKTYLENKAKFARDKAATLTPAVLGATLMASLPEQVVAAGRKSIAAWVEEVNATTHQTGHVEAVGSIKPSIIEKLKAKGIEPETAAITIDDHQLKHTIRKKKGERGQVLPLEIVKRLPELLDSPKAILWEYGTDEPTLLYVFDVSEEERLGKMVVRINYSEKLRGPDRKKRRVSTNSVRSGGLVETRVLTDENKYEVLEGGL